MGIRLFGNRQDVIAFGLAGLDAVECRTRPDLVAALDEVRDDPTVALVIVSPAVASLGSDIIAGLGESTRPPITVILPGALSDTADRSGGADRQAP
jgi:vacuolar-type H+-ATPase subunit F/Vma7